MYDDSRSAYLAELALRLDPEVTTFQEWISRAIEKHAARTPQQRAKKLAGIAEGKEPYKGPGWGSRTFNITVRSRAALDKVMAEGIGRGPSQFAADAIRVATEEYRAAYLERFDQPLPVSQGRLPAKK